MRTKSVSSTCSYFVDTIDLVVSGNVTGCQPELEKRRPRTKTCGEGTSRHFSVRPVHPKKTPVVSLCFPMHTDVTIILFLFLSVAVLLENEQTRHQLTAVRHSRCCLTPQRTKRRESSKCHDKRSATAAHVVPSGGCTCCTHVTACACGR